MLVGYARVSTQDQNLDLQLDALRAAGCEKVFVEKASGAQRDRPQLHAALDFARAGDTLAVWRLDRLARSLKQLIETVEELEAHQVGFRSLNREHRHNHLRRPAGVPHLREPRRIRALDHPRAHPRRSGGGARPRPQRWSPPALAARDLAAAKALLRDPAITVEEVARRLRVAPSTLYRHLPGGRRALGERT